MAAAAPPGARGRTAGYREAVFGLLGALTLAAWLALWLWQQSPYARFLEHGDWSDAGLLASLCGALPGGGFLVPAALYAGGWALMTAAMMLPTVFPLLEMFQRLTRERGDRGRLVAAVVAGYLGVWLLFGLGAHALDWGLHRAAAANAWLTFNGWALGAAAIALAGAFQFSALKYRCLDKCRSPLSFVIEHWRGYAPLRHAFLLGAHHGVFCVGCCWALMLLMFAVGTGNLGWMLALAAVMAAEKTLRWGRHLAKPLGAALLTWAGAILLANVI
jgi:predicted metal-binding membrane protein